MRDIGWHRDNGKIVAPPNGVRPTRPACTPDEGHDGKHGLLQHTRGSRPSASHGEAMGFRPGAVSGPHGMYPLRQPGRGVRQHLREPPGRMSLHDGDFR